MYIEKIFLMPFFYSILKMFVIKKMNLKNVRLKKFDQRKNISESIPSNLIVYATFF